MKMNTKIIFATTFALLLSLHTQAQKFMGIGTDKPNPKAVLELKVEDPTNFQQGFLPPRLLQSERITFGTSLGTIHKGMTVYDTTLDKYFVWNGLSWDQLALTAGTQSFVGVGGITVTTTGLTISIDGSNFVEFSELITPKDIKGSYADGFTVSGLSSVSIVGVPTAAAPILSFNGTNFVYASLPMAQITSVVGINGIMVGGSDISGFTINGQNFLTTADGLSFVRTIVGLGGINVGTIAGGGYTIDGSSFVATSISGTNGILIGGTNATGFTVNGQNFLTTADGLSFVRTIVGLRGINVGTIAGGGYTIDGSSFVATSISGANGILIGGTNATGFTVNGQNFLTTADGLSFVKTIVGLGGINVGTIAGGGYTIDGSSFVATSISGANGILIGGTNAIGFTVNGQNFLTTADGLSFVKTIVGLGGINVGTIAGGGYTIDGSSFVATSISGSNGILIGGTNATGFTVNGQNFLTTADGLSFVKTIVGLGNITVGTIPGGYTISGANAVNTVVGVSGLQVAQTGQSVSVSGASMVLASQSLGNPIGTSIASFGANPLSRAVLQIPAGVKNIKVVISAYKLLNAGTAAIGIKVGALATQSVTITSDDVELTYTSSNIDVSANTGTQTLKIFGEANAAATGVMLAGYTVYVVD